MDDIKILKNKEIPFLLTQISQPPQKLYLKGSLPKEDAKVLCVVGSRKYSNYGEEVCKKLIGGLVGYNICIVSGLAFGIDAIAHRAALESKLQTVSFPGSGLDPKVLYPQKHKKLAEEIVYYGGGLVSEFEMTYPSLPENFPRRNRLMAGISHATLVIEARERSGTLITSRLALDYNRNVGAVPGQIFSPLAKGPNDLIFDGATIVRNSDDILELLGLARRETQGKLDLSDQRLFSLGENERKIIKILQRGPVNKDILVNELSLNIQEFNILISTMEMDGYIKEVEGFIKFA